MKYKHSARNMTALYGLPPSIKGHGGNSEIFGCCRVNNTDRIIWAKTHYRQYWLGGKKLISFTISVI